ncbi:glycosyltransferase family 1 protein [Fibrobacter sp. UWH1]|uniref:glycosyltransferase family 1 protein n=1 Tax=Fibrobacter sp. UWH1 TaxID=1964354 RepID=UPI000B52760E|nr:glycosyltransferase family 1 protein [Fibrobacter sp. UWH1]OWV06482.1 hypothetical protein B7992_14860 [Fibrobacter sp. UWH1]
MNVPLRVLHVTEVLSAAGIESFFMNLYRRVDRSKVQFDFLVLRNEHEFYEDEVNSLGGKKYFIESKKKNTLVRIFEESVLLEKFLKEHHYDIVHIHYTTPLRAPYLRALKRAGVKTRIYHSHSAYVSGKGGVKLMIYAYMRKIIEKYATHFFACSQVAAEWMFSANVLKQGWHKVIHNGIDTKKFAYNASDREDVRTQLGINGKKVLIHTGRFLEQKNQSFVVDVFADVKRKCPNSVLLLLGIGPLQDLVKQKVHNLGLESDVFFLDVKPDVYRYLSAADCYIMPSLYEGLPVAAVEAECSGLPCVFSTNITEEVALTSNVSFLKLTDSIEKWSETVVKSFETVREDFSAIVLDHGYDVQNVAENMQAFYLSL